MRISCHCIFQEKRSERCWHFCGRSRDLFATDYSDGGMLTRRSFVGGLLLARPLHYRNLFDRYGPASLAGVVTAQEYLDKDAEIVRLARAIWDNIDFR